MEEIQTVHWADMMAEKIIRQLGEKDAYVLASGITPSGVVHFGNFREVMTVELVARALLDRGKKVRFIFSWDDFDTFRKVPKNMPKQDELEKYLFQPIVDTPDPFGEHESYAAHNQKVFEKQLLKMGIKVHHIYQARQYRKGAYTESIKRALKNRDVIVEILNKHRTEPLERDWWPVSVYCEKCNRDRIKSISYDGESTLHYECELCGHIGDEKIENSTRVKLPWRVDWPMRWAFEKVDFEPGGKDHSSEGGSYTTAKEIVQSVYGRVPPLYLQYDFISVKGAGGKMSSSQGNLITVDDVLSIYEPEMVRWIFASYKSNVDFAISFDLDVVKLYEDFDRQERLAYGVEKGNEKKTAMAKRVYELAQIDPMPKEMPFQPSFRHLCNILQIHGGDLSKARSYYEDEIKNPRDERRFKERSERALFWLENYAPEDFKFKVNENAPKLDLGPKEKAFVEKLHHFVEKNWNDAKTEKDLHERIYAILKEDPELKPEDAFKALYQLIISKDKGPKLAALIKNIGRDKALNLIRI